MNDLELYAFVIAPLMVMAFGTASLLVANWYFKRHP
jgi:hypothetical protein